MEYPKQPELLRGWQIDFTFLKEIRDTIKSKTGEKLSLEAIEDVLIAAEKATKKRSLT